MDVKLMMMMMNENHCLILKVPGSYEEVVLKTLMKLFYAMPSIAPVPRHHQNKQQTENKNKNYP